MSPSRRSSGAARLVSAGAGAVTASSQLKYGHTFSAFLHVGSPTGAGCRFVRVLEDAPQFVRGLLLLVAILGLVQCVTGAGRQLKTSLDLLIDVCHMESDRGHTLDEVSPYLVKHPSRLCIDYLPTDRTVCSPGRCLATEVLR